MGVGNFLQGLAPAIDPNSQLAVAPLQQPMPTPIPMPNLGAPRQRRSMLDTVGRIADVFARVGGADPMFQQMQDADLARTNAAEDRTRMIDLDGLKRQLVEQQIASGNMEAATAENGRLGQAVRGLRAIQSRGGDVNAAWPLLAQQAGISPERSQIIAQAIGQNPGAIEGLHAELNGEGSFGLQLRYANDAQGNTRPYVTGKDGQAHFIDLPAGMTAADPASKTVNLGGTTALVGANSGRVTRILPNTERPGAAADRSSRERIAAGGNASRERVATQASADRRYGIETRANKPAAGEKGGAKLGAVNYLLDNIAAGFADLHGQGALPGDKGGVGGALAAIGRTSVGQAIGEQTGNSAAQRRLSIEKDINSLQSEMVKSLPASATRTKFEQEIQRKRLPDPSRMSWATSQAVIADLRQTFAQAQKDAAAEVSNKAPARRPTLTPRPRSGGNNGGWSVVGVK